MAVAQAAAHVGDELEDVLDRYAGKQFAPRFLGFPDDRDFFVLTRRDGAP